MSDYLCLECGKPTPSNRAKKSCSPECYRLYINRVNNERHHARKADPEYLRERRERSRAHYERNAERTRDARLAATADWRRRNADRIAEYERRYRREKAEAVRAKNLRRRARLLDALVEDVDPQVLWERDGGTCGICKLPVDHSLPWPHKMSKTVDHVVPLSLGGEHSYANTQIAHAVCNSRKNNRLSA